jgi:hypothetical protein
MFIPFMGVGGFDGSCNVPKLGEAYGDWDCGRGERRCRLDGGGMPPLTGEGALGEGEETGGDID